MRQAKQTWLASSKRRSSAATNSRAPPGESAGATNAKKREPRSRSSASAAPVGTR
jgi:hypothetical protein